MIQSQNHHISSPNKYQNIFQNLLIIEEFRKSLSERRIQETMNSDHNLNNFIRQGKQI